MIAFIFPGQGSQYPGMAQDLYKEFSVVRHLFEEAGDLIGRDFAKLLFESATADLMQTDNSQLAIYLSSMAALRALSSRLPELKPHICAGLSLGEYTALTASGKISFSEGIVLVEARGRYMQEACTEKKGFMAAVLGLECNAIHEALKNVEDVWVANVNCPGQVVIAGSLFSMEKATLALKAIGAKRVVPLDVAGAFHTPFMARAQAKLKSKILELSLIETPVEIVMNAVGDFVSSQESIRELMNAQMVSPVLWEPSVRAMDAKGVKLYVELGCGKTLAGMHRKIGVQGKTCSVGLLADILQLEEEYAAIKR